MKSPFIDPDRRILPRWKDVASSIAGGEVAGLMRSSGNVGADSLDVSGEVQFDAKREDWLESPSNITANEFVSAAIVAGRQEEALEAARYLRDSLGTSVAGTARMVREVLRFGSANELSNFDVDSGSSSQPPTNSPTPIGALRHKLSDNPYNPLAWVSLSREYISEGQKGKAANAMYSALGLAPNHRFVLRCAARLFAHIDKGDVVLKALRKSDRTHHDPWLLATEIALASTLQLQSYNIKDATNMVESGVYSDRDLSELSAAVATVHLNDGCDKKARKLFKFSLIDPTENSVAQAGWAGRKTTGIIIPERVIKSSQEAMYFSKYLESDWNAAIVYARQWLMMERFSIRPVLQASFVSMSIFQDYSEARSLLSIALRANPDSPTLLNNIAVSEALLGNLQAANSHLTQAIKAHNHKSTEEPCQVEVLQATMGLVNFRSGHIEAGRKLYKKSIESFKAQKDFRRTLHCMLYLCREEYLSQTNEVESIQKEIQDIYSKYPYHDFKVFVDMVMAYSASKRENVHTRLLGASLQANVTSTQSQVLRA